LLRDRAVLFRIQREVDLSSARTFDFADTLTKNRFLGLWRVLRGFRLVYTVAILSLGIAAVGKTATFYLIRYFIDGVLGQSERAHLIPLVAEGFVGLALVQGAFSFLSGRLAARASEGVIRRIRNYLYDHMQNLPFSYHDRMPTGELIQRATSDVEAVRRLFAMQTLAVGRILFLFIINFAALLSLNVRLTFISIAVIPLVMVLSILFSRWIASAYESYQDQEASLSTTLQENLSGIRVVKAFGRWDFEKRKFEQDNREKLRLGKKLVVTHALFWPISDCLCGLQMMVGYAFGAWMVIGGEITLGTFLAYTGMVVQIVWPIRMLGRVIVQMATGVVSFERIGEIIREQREPLFQGRFQARTGMKGEIVFDHVSFHYDRSVPVLRDISFICRPGQAVALLGPPGSGKTSLVNLLPRFYDYSKGRLLLDGGELKDYSRHFLRKHIGIVEQEPFLFSRTVRENITYGVEREVSDDEVVQAARFAAIHNVITSFPKGYETVVGERGVTLSGGQKQRIAIARTLLKDPRILILDDSTSSVDMETEMIIRKALERLMRDRTTFVIAHRIQSLMKADLILVLDQGRIIQRGTHRELVRQEGFYRKIFEMQSQLGEMTQRGVR
jgi:ATP-binding cassette subfamily B protein